MTNMPEAASLPDWLREDIDRLRKMSHSTAQVVAILDRAGFDPLTLRAGRAYLASLPPVDDRPGFDAPIGSTVFG